jgi:hypothetical protein
MLPITAQFIHPKAAIGEGLHLAGSSLPSMSALRECKSRPRKRVGGVEAAIAASSFDDFQ